MTEWSGQATRPDSPSMVLAIFAWFVGIECAACEWLGLLPTQSRIVALVEVVLLLAAPAVWFLSRRGSPLERAASPVGRTNRTASSLWWQPILVAASTFAMCWWTARSLSGLPPSIHDEYSYLFQAKTFLAGRLWFPSHPALPELFDQMHVLNEGRFASRYFPGTGLWLAPFVALGNPWIGEWIAMSLAAALVFATARTLAGGFAGFVGGFIVALSPGIALFGNRLLSHGPTLLGLSVFLFAIFRLRQAERIEHSEESSAPTAIAEWQTIGLGVVAGSGLCFAMLCRPLTAAAVALPWGIRLIWPRHGSSGEPWLQRIVRRRCAAVALPVALGLAGLFLYNREITGNGWLTPYSLYNRIYTPRHVYGFHNGEWGDREQGPKVLRAYDAWATDLTLARALENAWTRWSRSWLWTLGAAPLAFSLFAALGGRGTPRGETGLIAASILSLNAAYFPYWYDGIDGWHYIFETLPLWGLLCGFAAAEVRRFATEAARPWLTPWWCMVLLVAGTGPWLSAAIGERSELDRALARAASRRGRFRDFQEQVAEQVTERPAIILVEQPTGDFHVDFVVNDPELTRPILYGRWAPNRTAIHRIEREFPDRTLYVYRESSSSLEKVD